MFSQKTKILKTSYKTTKKIYAEGDIIVPDIKPDVATVIATNGILSWVKSEIKGGKLEIHGTAEVTSIYISDNSSIKSMLGKIDFGASIEGRFNDGEEILVVAKLVSIEGNAVNSRKVIVRMEISLTIEACEQSEIEYLESDDESNFELKNGCITLKNTENLAEGQVPVHHVISVPSGLPAMDEVLMVEAKIVATEEKLAGNKVLLKGEIEICPLYTSEHDDILHKFTQKITFTDILSLGKTVADAKVDYTIENISYAKQEDENGESRILAIDLQLKARACADAEEEFEFLQDAYSLERETECEHGKFGFNRIIGSRNARLTLNDGIPLNGVSGDVYSIKANAEVTKTRNEGGKLYIEGELILKAVLTMENPDMPLKVAAKAIPFTSELESLSPIAEALAEVASLNYSLSLAGELEIKADIEVTAAFNGFTSYEYLKAIEEIESEEFLGELPYAIRIYYVKNGDSIWNIAKKYKIKSCDLIERNGEQIEVGQKLILEG